MRTFNKHRLPPPAEMLIEEAVASTLSQIEKGGSKAAQRYLVSIFQISLNSGVEDPTRTPFGETLLAELNAKADAVDADPKLSADIRSVIKGVGGDVSLKRVLGHMPRGSAFNNLYRRRNI